MREKGGNEKRRNEKLIKGLKMMNVEWNDMKA